MRSLMFCDFLNPDAVSLSVIVIDCPKYAYVAHTYGFYFLSFSSDGRGSFLPRSGVNK